jgi:hypothetical protein
MRDQQKDNAQIPIPAHFLFSHPITTKEAEQQSMPVQEPRKEERWQKGT